MIVLKEIDKNNKSFEDIKHIDENRVEFWYARELMPILQYSNWQNFKDIEKAKMSCENSDISMFDHFNGHLLKLILQFKQESKKLQKKNTVCLQKMKKILLKKFNKERQLFT